MFVLGLLVGAILSGTIAWWYASQRAAEESMQTRVAMQRELRHWQEAAERANAEAERLAREIESWSAGCKQGREDVISIMPLLMAAQQRQGDLPPAVDGRETS
jgi:hypothetical protein